VLRPVKLAIDDHTNWRAARPDVRVPLLASIYHYDDSAVPIRAWDDEIVAIATDGSGTVWRFAHHQSVYDGDFWSQPIAIASPDGRWAMFTTNWGHTLGAARQDVLLVELK
jgi:hypothetical protein